MQSSIQQETKLRIDEYWRPKWMQELNRKVQLPNKANKDLSVFEERVKKREESFNQAFKAGNLLREEVKPERIHPLSAQKRAQWELEDTKAKIDGIGQSAEPIKFTEMELRERWLRIHRIRRNEFKRLGISQGPQKSRRAEKKEKKD
jgi:hypothetical protein